MCEGMQMCVCAASEWGREAKPVQLGFEYPEFEYPEFYETL